jgi:nucleoside-diphosphate-sugar epimerase
MTSHTVLVSGACGNLGRKVIEALAGAPWCERIIGIDRHDDTRRFAAEVQGRLVLVAGPPYHRQRRLPQPRHGLGSGFRRGADWLYAPR